ncbi:MAG: hypothetical protein AVDCRST_MAG01-01-4443 [uncultured Rubrobacteraceae bacterium]|uniref:Uncharacterized protein n=1 Tax=uncultured Rubrobacteraceae bacterium TaxID=349277 RepID=A0A6J4QNJ7_9ACTN|nr:MAG: hypothetical protein AVDCRST_MAG01-01-4443 [uncultured Rubrobacteraceae bacterium]
MEGDFSELRAEGGLRSSYLKRKRAPPGVLCKRRGISTSPEDSFYITNQPLALT